MITDEDSKGLSMCMWALYKNSTHYYCYYYYLLLVVLLLLSSVIIMDQVNFQVLTKTQQGSYYLSIVLSISVKPFFPRTDLLKTFLLVVPNLVTRSLHLLAINSTEMSPARNWENLCIPRQMGVLFELSVSQLQTEVLLKEDVPGGWVCGACIPSPRPGSLPSVTVSGGTTRTLHTWH